MSDMKYHIFIYLSSLFTYLSVTQEQDDVDPYAKASGSSGALDDDDNGDTPPPPPPPENDSMEPPPPPPPPQEVRNSCVII